LFRRAWIPFLYMFFFAVSFNLESVVTLILKLISGNYTFVLTGNLAFIISIISGIGFTISAVIFLYNFFDRYKFRRVSSYRENLNNYIIFRYVGEYFRVHLHFSACNFPVSESILNKTIRDYGDPQKQQGAIITHRLLRKRSPADIEINNELCIYLTKHLKDFVDCQINYQMTCRVIRYSSIVNNLTKWINVFLIINASLFIIRAGIQFATSGAFLHNYSQVRETTDMIMILLLAWHNKNERLRDDNFYSGYLNIAEKILKRLYIYKANIEEIVLLQNKEKTVSYERLRSLAEDTLENLISELYWWCDITKGETK